MASRKRAKKRDSSVDRQVLKSEKHLRSLLALSSDWYWEQDNQHRFTVFVGDALTKVGLDPRRLLGTRRWDHAGVPLNDSGGWDAHKATLAARKPFVDLIYRYIDSQGRPHYLSVSGEPIFDSRKRFKGYRGIGKDV